MYWYPKIAYNILYTCKKMDKKKENGYETRDKYSYSINNPLL